MAPGLPCKEPGGGGVKGGGSSLLPSRLRRGGIGEGSVDEEEGSGSEGGGEGSSTLMCVCGERPIPLVENGTVSVNF